MNKKILLVLALSAALPGCSVMIDKHEPVPGWPELKIVEHHVAHTEVRDRCKRFVSPLSFPEGCTLFYFDRSEAHIYVSKDFPTPWILEHERLHAAGYDHIGSKAMLHMLEAWKESRRRLAKLGPMLEEAAAN